MFFFFLSCNLQLASLHTARFSADVLFFILKVEPPCSLCFTLVLFKKKSNQLLLFSLKKKPNFYFKCKFFFLLFIVWKYNCTLKNFRAL